MPQALRVHNSVVRSDGYGSGVGQSLEHPFGHANPADLFSWAGATTNWVNRTDPGGTDGLDDYCARDLTRNIGAEIMGRNELAPKADPGGTVNWKGWWGDTRPSIPRCSYLPITCAPRSPCPIPPSTSSMPRRRGTRAGGRSGRWQGRALGGGVATGERVPRRRSRRPDAFRGGANRAGPG